MMTVYAIMILSHNVDNSNNDDNIYSNNNFKINNKNQRINNSNIHFCNS